MAVAIVIANDNGSVHGPRLVTVHDRAKLCKSLPVGHVHDDRAGGQQDRVVSLPD